MMDYHPRSVVAKESLMQAVKPVTDDSPDATGEQQMQLMMDFLHEAGARAYTGVPSASEVPASAGAEAAEE